MESQPVLKIGVFGTHIIKNPAGSYSFVGTVPEELDNTICETEVEAMSAFVDFYCSMNISDQRHHAGNLRNDVFAMVQKQNNKNKETHHGDSTDNIGSDGR